MPFNEEAMKAKLKKKKELDEKVKNGSITVSQAITQARMFDRSLDIYGLCDPDTIDTIDSSDID